MQKKNLYIKSFARQWLDELRSSPLSVYMFQGVPQRAFALQGSQSQHQLWLAYPKSTDMVLLVCLPDVSHMDPSSSDVDGSRRLAPLAMLGVPSIAISKNLQQASEPPAGVHVRHRYVSAVHECTVPSLRAFTIDASCILAVLVHQSIRSFEKSLGHDLRKIMDGRPMITLLPIRRVGLP